MGELVFFLAIGAVVSVVISMVFDYDLDQFLMNLIFTEALEVLMWYFLYGKDMM